MMKKQMENRMKFVSAVVDVRACEIWWHLIPQLVFFQNFAKTFVLPFAPSTCDRRPRVQKAVRTAQTNGLKKEKAL